MKEHMENSGGPQMTPPPPPPPPGEAAARQHAISVTLSFDFEGASGMRTKHLKNLLVSAGSIDTRAPPIDRRLTCSSSRPSYHRKAPKWRGHLGVPREV